jgi:hypothetical protein
MIVLKETEEGIACAGESRQKFSRPIDIVYF